VLNRAEIVVGAACNTKFERWLVLPTGDGSELFQMVGVGVSGVEPVGSDTGLLAYERRT
jgi:hypothetical protein